MSALHIPTDAERIRVEKWLIENRSQYLYYDEASSVCASNFGLWEGDTGFDGSDRLFPPMWMVELAKQVWNKT